jgi:hypothetical protein
MQLINIFDQNYIPPDDLANRSKYTIPVLKKKKWDGITFFVDDSITEVSICDSKIKIALLNEPRAIKPNIYQTIETLSKEFDYIFTFDDYLLKNVSNSVFCPYGRTWIKEKNHKIYEKNKLVNIVVSYKKWTFGHKLRHQIIKKYNYIEAFGKGINNFDKKEDVCIDYMFQIVVENSSVKNYFTEKILDCFATGTIPIYWGCKNIGDFFDKNGILDFKNFTELDLILNKINKDVYFNMIPYIERNLKTALQYMNGEDWMVKNIKQINWEINTK